MRLRFSIACVLVALMALLGSGAPALAAADTVSVVQNTKDDSSVFKLAFNIHRVMSSEVDTDNAAVAVASCDSCQTIAVSISVVLIFSDPDVVTTDNLALALNIECTLCQTMALAYQLVMTTDGPVHLTAEANRQINAILKQIREIADSDLSLAEIEAQISQLVSQLFDIVRQELVAAGQSGDAIDEDRDSDTTTSSPSPEPTTTTDPSPTPTTSDEPTPEPTATATAEPTPTPTDQATP